MNDPTKLNARADDERTSEDLDVLTQIVAAFQRLEPESRERMLQTVATFLGLNLRPGTNSSPLSAPSLPTSRNMDAPFSEDRSISPKQFMFEKQPRTDVEKVACLAYYLTHYLGTPHFKTLDISKLNTDAAQVKFSNPAVAVDNATKQNYLVPASKGSKQLSALGEQFVLALPDRDRAKQVMANARPRRRAKKGSQQEQGIGDGGR